MKILRFFALLSLILICYSCIKDDSSLADKSISNIVVKTNSDTISIDFGYDLIIDPEIEQSQEQFPLEFEWSYQELVKTSTGGYIKGPLVSISKDKVLKYAFKKIAQYIVRLKVTNDHGSTFKYSTVFVKAAFDQGIFVLSADEQKKGRVSFMRPLSKEEITLGKEETFYTSAFSTVNPDFALNDPTDAEKIGSDLFITSRGDNLVYRIDAQTFDIYNTTDFKDEFKWMSPLSIISKDRSIANYIVFSENGGFTRVNYKSDIAYDGDVYFKNMEKVDKIYSKITGEPLPPSTSVTNMRNYQFFMNYEKSKLYYIYDLSTSYTFERDFADQDLLTVVLDRNLMTCVVGKSKSKPNELVITRGYASNKGPLDSKWEYRYINDKPTLTRDAIIQSNNTYNSVFYSVGGSLYRWFNWNSMPVLPQDPILKLAPGEEITCFGFSQDNKEIYLGVYNPNATGLKGSVYVYNADTVDPETTYLKLVKKFVGVADKPIKVFWKNNRK